MLWILWTAPAHLRGTLAGVGSYADLDSEVMRYLRDNPSDTDLYSNAIDVAYFHSIPGDGFYRILPYYHAADPYAPSNSGPRDTLSRLLERSWHGDHVVWTFNPRTNNIYDYDDSDMRAHAGLRLVADLADGAVFEVEKILERERSEWLSGALLEEPEAQAIFDVRLQENRLVYSSVLPLKFVA